MPLRIVRLLLAFLILTTGNPLSSAYPQTSETPPIEKFEVYQTLLPGRSLLTSPQFLVIDDFNDGKLKNMRGSPWQSKTPAIGALDLALDKADGRNAQRGYSLKLSFNLSPGEQASFHSLLNRADVSQAKFFVFKYKLNVSGPQNFTGRFRVQLTDWRHQTVTQDITQMFPASYGGWGEVVLPLSFFRKLDLDQLFSVNFSLVARGERFRGELWLDEIAFFGFNDVAFESLRDNLAGFPKTIVNARRRTRLLEETDDRVFLKGIAYDTWKYFENARDKTTHLIVDHLRLGDAPLASDYTSPTNIAMDFLSIVSAMDLGFITREQAIEKIRKIFSTLEKMRRYKGFLYNFYDTKKLQVTRNYISTVDAGWFAISLVVLRQAFPREFGRQIRLWIDSFSFYEFLDPENNQLVVGLEVPERNFGNYHYGLLATEARATSFYAIGKGDVPRDHWWFLYRTPPKAWRWQTQKPKGKFVMRDGIEMFQGYYKYGKKEFVPSWGGSLFEFLMPTLVMKERELAPHGLGLNNRIATELQRDYALNEKHYPVWGISPASTRSGRQWRYSEFGVKSLGVKGYPDSGIITPHVSFLALDSLPDEAILNIRKLMGYEAIYGEYGFYDSVNVRNNIVNFQYLTLDQGMSLVAICNYLEKGSIQRRFHQDVIAKRAEDLLVKESFFNP
ncbi:MAG TPA: glucoamylase family protein [bacterium]|nr:glucoamylase family protein [bacterium]